MSSISAYSSPLQLLQSQLQSSISSGTIKSADQDALTAALTDIDSSLTASRSTDTSTGKPGDLKSKVDDLIASEVSSGKLTSDQATELKSVFDDTFGKGGSGEVGGAGGPGGPGGPGGAGGPPPGPPPSDSADSSSTDDSDDSDSSTTTSASDILQQFLKSLQASLEAGNTSSYSAAGSSSTGSSFTALLIDYKS